jgi:hypothetical protein
MGKALKLKHKKRFRTQASGPLMRLAWIGTIIIAIVASLVIGLRALA